MGNMSYCRFQNTKRDLIDCEDHIEDMDLSDEENEARKYIITIAMGIARQFEGMNLNKTFEDNKED